MKTTQEIQVNNRNSFFNCIKKRSIKESLGKKLNEPFALLFMKEDEMLPKREMHFPEQEKWNIKRTQGLRI